MARRSRRGLWAISVATLATTARAQTESSVPDHRALSAEAAHLEPAGVLEAREAFRLGSALAKQEQWAEALSAFQRSAELKPHPVTTYDIGYCQRALGRPVSAYESFGAALDWTASTDVLPGDTAAQARAFLSEAEGRIVRVSVSLPAAVLSLRVDGAALRPLRDDPRQSVYVVRGQESPAAALPSHLELWLDPGPHVFVLTHGGGARAVENVTFPAGAHESLVFEAPAAPAAGDPGPRSPDRTAAWISFGVAAAGLGTAAVFAGLALHDKSTLNSDPRCSDELCPDEEYYNELRSSMTRNADIATVGVVVSGAAALLGTYFWITAKPKADAGKAGAGVRAFVGPGSAGVFGRF
jgi:hypothetical protein